MHARWASLIRWSFSLVAVGILAYVVNWGRFIESVRHADLRLLLIACGFYVFDRLQMSYKWGLLLKARDLRVPFWENWSLYSLASLWATVLPATVGADALRGVWVWRRTGNGAAGAASIVLERLVGFVIGLSVAAVSVLYLVSRHQGSIVLRDLLVSISVLLPVVVVGVGMSFSRRVSTFVARLLGRRAESRATRLIGRVGSAYLAYRGSPGLLAGFAALTLLEQLMSLFMGYLVAVAVGVQAGMLDFGAALAVALLVSRLPIAVDGIGVLEGVLVLLLNVAGVPPAQTVAFALIGRFMNVLGFAPGAAVALFALRLRPEELRRAAAARNAES